MVSHSNFEACFGWSQMALGKVVHQRVEICSSIAFCWQALVVDDLSPGAGRPRVQWMRSLGLWGYPWISNMGQPELWMVKRVETTDGKQNDIEETRIIFSVPILPIHVFKTTVVCCLKWLKMTSFCSWHPSLRLSTSQLYIILLSAWFCTSWLLCLHFRLKLE